MLIQSIPKVDNLGIQKIIAIRLGQDMLFRIDCNEMYLSKSIPPTSIVMAQIKEPIVT